LLPLLLLGEPSAQPPGPAAPSSACDDPSPAFFIESEHDAAVHAAWLNAARHRVQAKWKVPRVVRDGEVGTVVLRFVVNQHGKVRELETVCATGVSSLEKASRRAVKAASPLEPFPAESERDSLTLRWRFRYEWRKTVDQRREYPAQHWVR